ncbi:uncharacterized protein LOC131223834 isoform X1 [Magnolia sinica]|uniref:uncharacterized protein LOC131223834 isoform X1 n=1 Tax=Magnolia sinica TaxID=86752 RepID=UPI00265A7BFE|nr:uncharacterized protein LOC131223834 isoform X1 [Magnolia sinica]
MDSAKEEEREMAIVMQAMVACVSAVGEYCHVYMFRQLARHEDDERARFINSIIWATEVDCIAQLGMSRDAFFELCTTLCEKIHLLDTRHVSLEEQVVMFLHTVGHNVHNRVIGHRFIQSGETISLHFNRVLDSIVSLYPEFVKQLSSKTPPEIQTNISWAPYFQDCVGAIDGTHIPALVQSADHVSFRNRKGFLSQNVLVAYSFDMNFLYILAGWEGSVSNARVLHNALTQSDDPLHVPHGTGYISPRLPIHFIFIKYSSVHLIEHSFKCVGKYYVVDTGYAHSPGFMAPYRSMCHHLQEYRTVRAPANMNELFN